MSTEINLIHDVGNDNGLKTKKASSPVVKISKNFSLKTNKKRVAPGDKGRGVVFVKNIPHGFYENEMEKFFGQFGGVTRVRLSRSKRTGKSRGYGYVEFVHENTAKVVADSMKDYLMFRKRVMCAFVPKAELHPNTFRGWQRPFSAPKASQIDIRRQNRPHKTPKAAKLAEKRLKTKNAKRMAKITNLGVSYELPV